MKQYPSIDVTVVDQPIYAFDKLDGSNIRAEWSRKNKFYKFGTRKRLLGEDDPMLGEARQLIINTFEQDLSDIFKKNRWDKAICFFEFYGPNSFAGLHEPTEEHQVTLFDVSYQNKGLMEPNDFLKQFGSLKIANLLYHGKANVPFIESVQNGTLEGMTFEGVVCKGKLKSPGLPWMFKIKNKKWIEKVKERYAGNEAMLREVL